MELHGIIVLQFVLHIFHNNKAYWKGTLLFCNVHGYGTYRAGCNTCDFNVHTFPKCESVLLLIHGERYIKKVIYSPFIGVH